MTEIHPILDLFTDKDVNEFDVFLSFELTNCESQPV